MELFKIKTQILQEEFGKENSFLPEDLKKKLSLSYLFTVVYVFGSTLVSFRNIMRLRKDPSFIARAFPMTTALLLGTFLPLGASIYFLRESFQYIPNQMVQERIIKANQDKSQKQQNIKANSTEVAHEN